MLRIWDLFRDDSFLCFPNYVWLVEVVKENVGANLLMYLLLIVLPLCNGLDWFSRVQVQGIRGRNE